MNNYKATPDCWEWQEKWASKEVPDEDSSCFLELRARVAKLEAQGRNYPETPDSSTPPPVATDEELDDTWHKTTGGTFLARRRAVYDLGVAHGQAGRREVADPAPVAGKVEELVADLRNMASEASAAFQFDDAKILYRAANMIQR
jgi:hypothetical protein